MIGNDFKANPILNINLAQGVLLRKSKMHCLYGAEQENAIVRTIAAESKNFFISIMFCKFIYG